MTPFQVQCSSFFQIIVISRLSFIPNYYFCMVPRSKSPLLKQNAHHSKMIFHAFHIMQHSLKVVTNVDKNFTIPYQYIRIQVFRDMVFCHRCVFPSVPKDHNAIILKGQIAHRSGQPKPLNMKTI